MRRKTLFRGRTAFVSLPLAVLAVAGCGGSTTTVAKEPPLPPGVERAPEIPKPINATYSVTLTGKSALRRGLGPGFRRGSPTGSAHAVVTTNASTNELCWKFSQLKNVTPTTAHLFRNFPGATGKNGYLLGRRYKSSGCLHLQTSTLGLLGEKPQIFFLNIHSAQYPGGAVRGALSG